MNATTHTTENALVRSRNSVLAYFGLNPHSRTERAAAYGAFFARVVMAGVFVGGMAIYAKSVGAILL